MHRNWGGCLLAEKHKSPQSRWHIKQVGEYGRESFGHPTWPTSPSFRGYHGVPPLQGWEGWQRACWPQQCHLPFCVRATWAEGDKPRVMYYSVPTSRSLPSTQVRLLCTPTSGLTPFNGMAASLSIPETGGLLQESSPLTKCQWGPLETGNLSGCAPDPRREPKHRLTSPSVSGDAGVGGRSPYLRPPPRGLWYQQEPGVRPQEERQREASVWETAVGRLLHAPWPGTELAT